MFLDNGLQEYAAKTEKCLWFKVQQLGCEDDQTDYNECYTCPKTPCLTSSLGFVSLVENSICGCGRPMDKKLQLIYPERNADSARGFVAGVDKFIVSDDLHVAPVTSTRTQSLARREGIRDQKDTFDKAVDIGLEEVTIILEIYDAIELKNVFAVNHNLILASKFLE